MDSSSLDSGLTPGPGKNDGLKLGGDGLRLENEAGGVPDLDLERDLLLLGDCDRLLDLDLDLLRLGDTDLDFERLLGDLDLRLGDTDELRDLFLSLLRDRLRDLDLREAGGDACFGGFSGSCSLLGIRGTMGVISLCLMYFNFAL